jgi:hypothetical protein
MRSAILQPDVPIHHFPAHKAIDNSKTQPGKTCSKGASNKSKLGAKRKVSETAFDEFGDAGIDDADFASAENTGFQHIDDFDDEARPNTETQRKAQKVSGENDSTIRVHEPRQLENGRWPCNHNCKDKTVCKHLCCREGLDKKPKPSKGKTSKKEAENPQDPKQTQLSVSISKSDKRQVAAQPLQIERSLSSQERNPPRGPTMLKLNTLHNNTKSQTQPVPLLSSMNSRVNMSNSSTLPARPSQSRSKASKAARRAAQSVYSDEFDEIDDVSLFDEPATTLPPTRGSPSLHAESDLFEPDLGDMLGDFSPPNENARHLGVLETPQDDETCDSRSYDFDDEFIFSVEQDDSEARKSDPPNVPQVAGKSAVPFLEISEDSIALGLSSCSNDQGFLSTAVQNPLGDASVVLEDQDPYQNNLPDKEFVEERPSSSDSATKVFMEELGTDLFNYIG